MEELFDGLFTEEHVIKGSSNQDYEGKVLVVRSGWFNDWSRKPENQLFLASCGFGCDPSKIGTAVFGKFLIDGEQTRLERYDFLGVLDEQYMPDWAKIKLYDLWIKERTK